MRLATIQTSRGPRAAVFLGTHYVDLEATDSSLPKSIRELIEAGPLALNGARQAAAKSAQAVRYEAAGVQLLPPIPDPPKIVCLGLNYRDHAIESGAAIPKEPILFNKYATALIGPEEPILLPPVSREVDYEAELVIVVGKRGRNVKTAEAMSYV